jgi:hypothetical protein
MSPPERLAFHQAHSQATMDDLKVWLTAQLEDKNVEPNSGLGEAITYMLKHWEPLTLFLRQPAAPLDKNYDSYCTSLSGSQVISSNRRRSDSFSPFFLTGRFSPTGS